MSPCRLSQRAFTLVELLAVIAIILIVAAILLPASAKLVERSRRIVCFNNMRSLQEGYLLGVSDREGRLPSSDTCSSYGTMSSNDWWVGTDDIRVGAVWPYVQEPSAYVCPSYPTPARDLLKRHYSLSTRIGSTSVGTNEALYAMSQVRRPAGTHVFIEEYDNRSVGVGPSPGAINGYVISRAGYWTDCPPTWHDMGAQFTYLDGHVEYHQWVGPKMATVDCYTWFNGQYGQYWPTTPGDTLDWNYILSGVNSAF